MWSSRCGMFTTHSIDVTIPVAIYQCFWNVDMQFGLTACVGHIWSQTLAHDLVTLKGHGEGQKSTQGQIFENA